jgi:NAD(P)H dehydrogenase (quinone)
MKYTILKHSLYLEMLPMFLGEKVLETGLIYLPAGKGKVVFTLREDMAELAAHILTSEGHENKEYDITADQAYSYDDIATIISNISGKAIRYVSPSVEEFTRTLTEANVPEEYIGMFAGFSLAIGEGELDETNSFVEQILGKKATSVEEYLRKVYS